MGGIVECGISIDSKSSPRRAAIEKAQTELRIEIDARNARKKELEFLEKGGNPLDFKFNHLAPLSAHLNLLIDQSAGQNVTSGAKTSIAFASSPHGDSVESSGKPGGSAGCDVNTDDNLLLLDGDDSNPSGGHFSKKNSKTSILASQKQATTIDVGIHMKEPDDSVVFRVGPKSQAYARRNRSRSNRDGVNTGSSRSSILPADVENVIGPKKLKLEAQADGHAMQFISNSKIAAPNCNDAPASNDKVNLKIDIVVAKDEFVEKSEAEGEGAMGSKTYEPTDESFKRNGKSTGVSDVSGGAKLEDPGVVGKETVLISQFARIGGEDAVENVDSSQSDKGMVDLPINDSNTSTDYGITSESCKGAEPSSLHSNETRHSNNNGILLLPNLDVGAEPNGHGPIQDSNNKGEHDQLKSGHDSGAVDENFVSAQSEHSLNSNLPIKEEIDAYANNVERLMSLDSENLASGEVAGSEKKDDMGDTNGMEKADLIVPVIASPPIESEKTESNPSAGHSTLDIELQNSARTDDKLSKDHEDHILNKARAIEANLKRAGEKSFCQLLEYHGKCHWQFVLEEMAWMANDFMQERLWKTMAAAQVCHWIASGARRSFEQINIQRKQRNVSKILALAVKEFWHSASDLHTSDETQGGDSDSLVQKLSSCETEMQVDDSRKVCSPVQQYAFRFLQYNNEASDYSLKVEAPSTPDRQCDAGISGFPKLPSGGNLYYIVAPGVMKAYRESVESQLMLDKKAAKLMHQDDFETSICNSATDGPQVAYDDEDETCTYVLPGKYEGGFSIKLSHKKRKIVRPCPHMARTYEGGADLDYDPYLESKSGNYLSLSNGKRPSNSHNVVTIPTKRVRTASRQRVMTPVGNIPGSAQVTSRTDASSGDTSSYQDDQSSLHGGSFAVKQMEVESRVDFDRLHPYDGNETCTVSKKKKKKETYMDYKNSFNLADTSPLLVHRKESLYDQRAQLDSIPHHEQEYLKRLEDQQLESNVIYGQHVAKKIKIAKQMLNTSHGSFTNPLGGSVTSLIPTQTSNLPNANKLRIVTNRDRGKKNKGLKAHCGNTGTGNAWSSFEDQALIVLVHDMGPNWELVSDAISSTLQFKFLFRKPAECKERHKNLMDKAAGDGADSADDSGSSQPYPSVMPGIPKGSARQLFQQIEKKQVDETLKAHFAKIISLEQQLHASRRQKGSHELKQIVPPHSSHLALSQACPSNLAGVVLTPLDLCDTSTDVLPLGYHGGQTGGMQMVNHQGPTMPAYTTTSTSPILQGSHRVVLGSNMSLAPTAFNAPHRDAQRFGVARGTSFLSDEQHRMQQYNNQVVGGRNIHQTGLPANIEHGVRMPGSPGMGMVSAMKGPVPISRPGFSRISSPGMTNVVPPGNMHPNSMQGGVHSPVSVHPSSSPSQGTTMLRPRDALQMMRSGQSMEDRRQMMMQDLPMQAQGNGGQSNHLSSISVPFSSTVSSPVQPVQPLPVQQLQSSHQMPPQPAVAATNLFGSTHHHPHIPRAGLQNPQQPAYSIRLPKERQMPPQRLMPQAPHSLPGAKTASAITSNPHIHHQKQPHSAQDPLESSSGMPSQNLPSKQKQKQQIPQSKQSQQQQQQQQRQQQQAQHAKMMNLSRVNVPVHHSVPMSAFPSNSKNQASDRNMVPQSPSFVLTKPGLNPSIPQTVNQSKLYSSFPQPPLSMPSGSGHSEVVAASQTLFSGQPQHPSSNLQQRRHVNPSLLHGSERLADPIHASTTERSDPGSSSISPFNHRKREQAYDAAAPTGSPQDPMVLGNDVSPNAQGLMPRQISEGVLIQGHAVSRQWQQQPQQQSRPVVQNSVYAQPSNSGPG